MFAERLILNLSLSVVHVGKIQRFIEISSAFSLSSALCVYVHAYVYVIGLVAVQNELEIILYLTKPEYQFRFDFW